MAVSSKFDGFNIVDAQYKVVNGSPIATSILVPKDVTPGQHPVIVRWHGGCFITGHRIYAEWFPDWLLEYAIRKQAIMISPDYRLLPESNGLDILQDIGDFFNWLATPKNLASHLPDGVSLDLDHLLVWGESAGGWLSLQSSLLPACRGKISAVVSEYPMIDLRDRYYSEDYEKHLFSPVAPQLDRDILRKHLASMEPGQHISYVMPPDRVPIVISSLQQGKFVEFLGDENVLYPLDALDDVDDLPPTWILHGTNDPVVPVEGTHKYEQKLKERLPKMPLHVYYHEGGDHGFDVNPSITLDTDWVKNGVDFIEKYWPHS